MLLNARNGFLPAAGIGLFWGALALAIDPAAHAQPRSEIIPVEEVIVTVTRQEQRVTDVPASVSAFTRSDLEKLDVKSFADLVRFTPGVSFDRATNTVSIRGITSTAGAGTTGVYIDDTPIQMRSLYFSANNPLPAVFDLDRVEILRGPQGTLFGAGSEGGTVRYVMAQPSLTERTAFGQSQVEVGEDGTSSYQAGLALGGPLVEGKLGFRLSAWGRREGGWIDKVDEVTGTLLQGGTNRNDTYVARAALSWSPIAGMIVTPSINFQKRERNNADLYWVGISDPGRSRLRTGTPERLGDQDRFYLPALSINYAFDGAELVATASYFDRLQRVGGYSATLYNLSYFQQLLNPDQVGGPMDPMSNPCPQCRSDLYPLLTPTGISLPGLPGYQANSIVTNGQKNWTSEVRLQSNANERWSWVAGVFYANNQQESVDSLSDPQLPLITDYLFGETMSDAWGMELLPEDLGFYNRTVAHDSQLSAYADTTVEVFDRLKLEAGVRLSWTRFKFDNIADGPENYGQTSGSGRQEETPISPKLGISYELQRGQLFYASFARGYRIGGANPPFPQSSCQTDLDALGLTSVPATYNSDSNTSYEVGAKNRLFGERLSLATSAFYVDWNRIQQANYLPSCGFQYTANLGQAVSKGFDLQGQFRPVPDLTVDLAIGYTEARYSADTRSGTAPSSALVVAQGDSLGGAPWTLAFGAQYDFDTFGRPAYVRADYQFASRNPWTTPSQNVATASFDPGLTSNPATSFVSARAGTAFGDWRLAFYAHNILDSRPQLDLSHQDRDTLLYEATTWRPRLFGFAISYAPG